MNHPDDVEIRVIDPEKNQYRIHGIATSRSLFGEWSLRIAWGRIGVRPVRERVETFADLAALERRRARKGYVAAARPPRLESASVAVVPPRARAGARADLAELRAAAPVRRHSAALAVDVGQGAR